jgi:hypothetical protein
MGNDALLYRCIDMGYYKDIDIARQRLEDEFFIWVRNTYSEYEAENIFNTYAETGKFPDEFIDLIKELGSEL